MRFVTLRTDTNTPTVKRTNPTTLACAVAEPRLAALKIIIDELINCLLNAEPATYKNEIKYHSKTKRHSISNVPGAYNYDSITNLPDGVCYWRCRLFRGQARHVLD